MAVTITKAGSTGGGSSPVYARFGMPADVTVYTVAFDSSYPTGGEDISSIFTSYKSVLAIFVQNHDLTIADNRMFIADLVGKKLIVLSAINTEQANASDLSALTNVKLLVVGTLK